MAKIRKPRWDRLRTMDWLTLLGYLISIPLDFLFNLPSFPGMGISPEKCDQIPVLNSIYNPFTFFRPGTNLESDVWNGVTLTAGTGATFSYIGRAIDWFTGRLMSPEDLKKERYRNIGATIGLSLGLLFGIGISALFFVYGGWSLLLILTALVTTLTMMRTLGGLGSRTMQVVDRIVYKNKGTASLKRNFDLSIIFSIFAAIIPIALLAVDGGLTQSIFEIIAFIATSIVLVASINSASHFIGRALDWVCQEIPLVYLLLLPVLKPLFKWLGHDGMLPTVTFESWKKHFWHPDNCTNENIGNLVGIVLGLALGLLIAFTLPVPGFLAAIPVTFILLKPLVVLLMMDRFVSISIRVGRFIDQLFSTETEKAPTILHFLAAALGFSGSSPEDGCGPNLLDSLGNQPKPPAPSNVTTLPLNLLEMQTRPQNSAGLEKEESTETFQKSAYASWQTKFSPRLSVYSKQETSDDEATQETWQRPTCSLGSNSATAA